jgi:CubicO group peptidase (beta-lactamase class C family)
MMLVEQGKVALDDPLTKYFPDAPASWREVTVRNLLSHTAGFGDYPKDFNFRKDWSEDELLKVVEAQRVVVNDVSTDLADLLDKEAEAVTSA